MIKSDITKLLTEHGTAAQVKYVEGLNEEGFAVLEAAIRADQESKNDALDKALDLIAKTMDESDFSDYVLFRALYSMLNIMCKTMPVFRDELDTVDSVDIANDLIVMGTVLQSVNRAVERGMENDGDTTVQG